ncbi:uncharacterized protein LOC120334982 isoform X1 [Styela clava]
MPIVSDMVRMYSHSQSKPGSGATGEGRRWPPVATPSAGNKPPPMTPKPKPFLGNQQGGRPSTAPRPFHSNENTPSSDGNIPQWKLDLQKRKGSGPSITDEAPKQENGWKKNSYGNENVSHAGQENKPQWKIDLERTKPGNDKPKPPSWKPPGATSTPKPTSSWLNRNQESNNEESNISKPNPPWGKPSSNPPNRPNLPNKGPPPFKPPVTNKPKPTTPWSERNKFTNSNNAETDFPPPPPPQDESPRNSFADSNTLAARRATPQNKSFSYNTMPPKPTIEKSSGSFGSSTSPKTARKEYVPPVPDSPKHRVSSFLHTKPAPPKPPGSMNYPEPPPSSPTPPPPPTNAKPKRSSGPPIKLPLPRDIFSRPPPIKTSKPPHVVLPNKGKRKSSPLPPPPMSSRPLPSPVPAGFPAPPPPTGSRDFPSNSGPSLPARPMLDLPSRPLPPPNANMRASPLPAPPPEPIQDEVYDDPNQGPPLPPPLSMSGAPPLPPGFRPPITSNPPPLLKKESSGLIPTWNDEEEAIYDETPDEPPPPALPPAGFPMPGSQQIPADDGEDMYEDLDEYMKLKLQKEEQKRRSANGSITSNDAKEKKEKERKKKEAEKKEKEIRKKFKIEGDIVPEGYGVVKVNCKGSGKNLGVTAGENIDVIRMENNSKGKWLIRNAQGDYGYVDSDKVTINIDQLRNQFGVGSRAPSGMVGGPPVPAIIPTMDDDDEVIYDTTADEDVYEEL